MTRLKALNMFLLQWFGVRLARRMVGDPMVQEGWTLLVGVLPFTGWKYNFVGPLVWINLDRRKS